MKKTLFGTLNDGTEVYSYTLKNDSFLVEIIERGAAVRRLVAYGVDIIGGFDTLEDYLSDTSHQGAIIGRIANRVENAEFKMDGVTYHLPKNNGENCLHGGCGFDHKMWSVTNYTDDTVTLKYISEDGEEGFPSELSVEVTYKLFSDGLGIDYTAVPSGKTPVSLTNHAYFNLDGLGGDVLNHTVNIYADSYTEVNAALIPTGVRPSVDGTPFDLRAPIKIGTHFGDKLDGYDHNFVIRSDKTKEYFGKDLSLCAEVKSSSLSMSVYTDQPGVQFYTGNFLGSGPSFKGGVPKIKHGAFCLETQTEPNSVNHGIGFYGKGEAYRHTTVYKVEKV